MKQEKWAPIKGYEGMYSISTSGRIKMHAKQIKNPIGKTIRNQKISEKELIDKTKNKKGYRVARLRNKQGKLKRYALHRLVAQTFIPNSYNKPQVNHKDGNKTNNAVENLEWCTNKENMKHAVNMGLVRKGTAINTAKLTEKQVKEIRKKRKKGQSYYSLSVEYGIAAQNIFKLVKKITWKHV